MNRIQRKRTKGWKMPKNTKYVGRPTKWGNPFRVDELGAEEAVERYRECILNNIMCFAYFDEIEASIQFDRFKWMAENIEQLKGHDLACFCPLSSPCHADVLIELMDKSTNDIRYPSASKSQIITYLLDIIHKEAKDKKIKEYNNMIACSYGVVTIDIKIE